jgi:hypothetical protein
MPVGGEQLEGTLAVNGTVDPTHCWPQASDQNIDENAVVVEN